jgi:hypothetical protein
MGPGDLGAEEILLDNDYPKTNSLSLGHLITNNSLLKGRKFTARWHATEHIDNWGN